MPTPLDNATIETGMTVDGGTGALYVTTQGRAGRDVAVAQSEYGQSGGCQVGVGSQLRAGRAVSLLASGWGPNGLAIYANIWPLTPLEGGGGATVGSPALHRSLDGGQTWEPLVTP